MSATYLIAIINTRRKSDTRRCTCCLYNRVVCVTGPFITRPANRVERYYSLRGDTVTGFTVVRTIDAPLSACKTDLGTVDGFDKVFFYSHKYVLRSCSYVLHDFFTSVTHNKVELWFKAVGRRPLTLHCAEPFSRDKSRIIFGKHEGQSYQSRTPDGSINSCSESSITRSARNPISTNLKRYTCDNLYSRGFRRGTVLKTTPDLYSLKWQWFWLIKKRLTARFQLSYVK